MDWWSKTFGVDLDIQSWAGSGFIACPPDALVKLEILQRRPPAGTARGRWLLLRPP
jgi:hypothetical protein